MEMGSDFFVKSFLFSHHFPTFHCGLFDVKLSFVIIHLLYFGS